VREIQGLPPSATEGIFSQLDAVQAARETAIGACRRAIRYAASAIRATHTDDLARAVELLGESEQSVRHSQEALRPYPAVTYAGFLQDAEKEYAEAVLTLALVQGTELPTWDGLSIGLPPWLNGLCEAASELRRQILDRLREGHLEQGERLLQAMDSVYELLMSVDYPDAITAGLRRNTDSLRAVLERTRSDLVTAALHMRLQDSLEQAAKHRGHAPGSDAS